jgi:ketosteroid isomerase-like protein
MKLSNSPVKSILAFVVLVLFASVLAACSMPKNLLPDSIMPDAEFNTLMVEADAAMHDAKWDLALNKLQQAGGLRPDDLSVKLKQGQVYQNSGRLALAHNAYQQIIDTEASAKGKNLEIVQKAKNYQTKLGFAPLDKAGDATQNQAAAAPASVDKQAAVTEAKSAELPVPVDAPVALPPAATEEAPQKPVNADQAQIEERIQAWAQAWQQKRVNDYFSFYMADFRGDQPSHAAWRKQRNARISAAGNISVSIAELKVEQQDADHAVVSFRQTYRSSSLTDAGIKTLRLKQVDGVWLIADEQFRK